MLPLGGANFLAKETAKHSRTFSYSPLRHADIHIIRHRLSSLDGGNPSWGCSWISDLWAYMTTAPGSEKNAESTDVQDAAIQHDLAPGDLEFTIDTPQPVAAIADEERFSCFEPGLVDDEVRLHLILVQARSKLDLDVRDEVARP